MNDPMSIQVLDLETDLIEFNRSSMLLDGSFGYEDDNGSFNGIMGYLQRNEAEKAIHESVVQFVLIAIIFQIMIFKLNDGIHVKDAFITLHQGMGLRPERLKVADFTTPYHSYSMCIAFSKEASPDTMQVHWELGLLIFIQNINTIMRTEMAKHLVIPEARS